MEVNFNFYKLLIMFFLSIKKLNNLFPLITGETEDDLEHQKKESRPKRIKNVSGTPSVESSNPPTAPTPTPIPIRPSSAASGTSTTSNDKKDLEDKKVEDQDGKQTPDSQKSMDDKTL